MGTQSKNFVKKLWMENINLYHEVFELDRVRVDVIDIVSATPKSPNS